MGECLCVGTMATKNTERGGESEGEAQVKERWREACIRGNLNRFLSILKPSAYCKLKINSTAGNGNEAKVTHTQREEEEGRAG